MIARVMPLLVCSPALEIPFHADPGGEEKDLTSILKLTNKETNGNVAYKVKTTAQKKYLVQPSNGILRPGESVDVQILLQSKYVPAEKEDRFMVLATQTTSDKKLERDEWANVEKTQVEDVRLKVVLLQSKDNAATGAAASNAAAKGAVAGGKKNDLKTKYDELFAYTLELERKKKQADTELDTLQSQLAEAPTAKNGIPLYVLLLAMVLAAAAARILQLP